ncbi:hypothetical protein SAMN06298216_0518 [Spirosomataceae bacterium TFI 002]|nr:hypothetical protein SAMN06298216_0518 [Spirosomataceae bacterium TFI 002]
MWLTKYSLLNFYMIGLIIQLGALPTKSSTLFQLSGHSDIKKEANHNMDASFL